jgi:anaerobic ribonucleoside-triphosphate reductase activating protein
MKYVDTKVVFQEVPDEVSLAINLSNCPCHCKGCHSPYLAEDIGEELTIEKLTQLATEAEGITTICFMGGDSDTKRLNRLAKWVHDELDLKVAWYSGVQMLSEHIELKNFDYIKLGPYVENNGPLTSETTNQKFYKVKKFENTHIVEDITNKFWNESKS